MSQKIHVVLTGGGSGGHTTPLVAVAQQLEKNADVKITVIAEKNKKESQGVGDYSTEFVWAGKLRRYHGESWFKRITDFESMYLNIRDIFKVFVGYFQALMVLRRLRPNVLFVKGGYVSLPVGLAAWTLGVPYVTHDSDVLPGLTNRLLAKGAHLNLTGFPVDNYGYAPSKVRHVGVPIRQEFGVLTRDKARKKLKLSTRAPLIVITGGSNGGRAINYAALGVVDQLSQLGNVFHQAGAADIEDLHSILKAKKVSGKTYQMVDFIEGSKMAVYYAAADVVVARAGATTLSELASLKKATIVVANPKLTGGHQLKNADVLMSHDGARILHEAELTHDPNILLVHIDELLRNKKEREWLGGNLQRVFKPNAARTIAKILTEIGGGDETAN